MKRILGITLILGSVFGASALPVRADDILFDATKREMAGNADWVIDADAWDNDLPAYGTCPGTPPESNPQQVPTPSQAGITPATPGTYWTGGISSWAVELAKAGHTVETLPPGGRITFNDGTNLQDLSNYDLFIVPEPQNPFSTEEKAAILDFVSAGGGLFMVGDHETSDRDCDNWDSPNIWNDLTGAISQASAGVFGIWMRRDGLDVKGEDWFDDGTDNNVNTDPADPIICGPFGDGTGGLGLFGSTSMDINPAIATAHVWRTGQAHNNFRVTFATATYYGGRVAAIGDSSPADDDSGDSGDTLYPGWDLASGGVNNREIHLNACHWLLNPTPDTTPPAITAGPSAAAADCSAAVTWTTDEAASSGVAYGLTNSYGYTASAAGNTTAHSVALAELTPSTTYHYQVSSTDPSGNGPTQSADHSFTTAAGTAPSITAGPAAGPVGGTTATITWTTDEAATSGVEYGATASYGSSASAAGYATSHSVQVTGLTPESTYHFRVLSSDSCGNGPASSPDDTFTTGPASLDISGWVLKQFGSTQTFTIPSGTAIPSGGYLVLARDATRAEFEAVFGALPAGAVFLNSNASGSCSNGCFPMINGDETFELWSGSTKVDGTTIAMAAGNAYQRKNPGDAPGSSSSWTTVGMAGADPGQGAGTPSGAGVVINEMADAPAWADEFIELYYDAGAAQSDTTPPAAVSDLSTLALSDTQIRLTWTAPGDDGTTGTAAGYDLRRSSGPITSDGLFSAATPISGVSAPQGAGSAEQFVVTGLSASTTYHFAIKTRDEVPNWSALSNSPSDTTSASTDMTPPAPIADLEAMPQSDALVRLTWTAPGDDGESGTAALYDVRRSSSRILTDADFAAATAVSGMTVPKAAGGEETFDVAGLTADTPYYFAVKTRDEVPNVSGLSNCDAGTTAPTGGGGSPPADHLVISQFDIAGGSTDLVELYNPTSFPISLSGYTLRNLSYEGNPGFSVALDGSKSVAARGWYLVAYSGYAGSPTADEKLLTSTYNFAKERGHVLLVHRVGGAASSCTDGDMIDKVGYGASATCPEGGSGKHTAFPTSGQSVVRKPGGLSGSGQDTQINSNDFLAPATSSFHNSGQTATPPSSLGNVGATLYLENCAPATDFAWANAAGATGGYRVYRGTLANFKTPPNTPSPWQTVATNSVTDSADPSPIYYYVIRATDGTNESAD